MSSGEIADDAESENMGPGQGPVIQAIDRMTAYLYQARPGSIETIVDEMLAITSEIEAWREKKESLEAQAGYSAWLNSETRRNNEA